MDYLYIILVGIAVLLVAKFLLRINTRRLIELAINILLGALALWLLNTLGGGLGINIPINWVTIIIAGILGIPGVIILLLLNLIGFI